jgi:hypothetical protein
MVIIGRIKGADNTKMHRDSPRAFTSSSRSPRRRGDVGLLQDAQHRRHLEIASREAVAVKIGPANRAIPLIGFSLRAPDRILKRSFWRSVL